MDHYRSSVWADERNGPPPPYINCVAAGGVNIARAATNGAIPATDAEVLGLRTDTGDVTGGEGLRDLQRGLNHRYGIANVLHSSWSIIEDGLKGSRWFVVIGEYSTLPSRLRNPGQGNVTHAVVLGPGMGGADAVIVDGLQFPVPEARAITFDEARIFCATGHYASLGVVEYAYTPHCSVGGSPRLFFYYTLHTNGSWTRTTMHTGGFSGLCTSAPDPLHPNQWPIVMGKRRRMVKMRTGVYAGRWLDLAYSRIHYAAGV